MQEDALATDAAVWDVTHRCGVEDLEGLLPGIKTFEATLSAMTADYLAPFGVHPAHYLKAVGLGSAAVQWSFQSIHDEQWLTSKSVMGRLAEFCRLSAAEVMLTGLSAINATILPEISIRSDYLEDGEQWEKEQWEEEVIKNKDYIIRTRVREVYRSVDAASFTLACEEDMQRQWILRFCTIPAAARFCDQSLSWCCPFSVVLPLAVAKRWM